MWYNLSDFPDIILPADAVEREEPAADSFCTDGPIEVDIGSGKGRFLLARAESHPDTRYLGIERQASRVYRVAKKAHRRDIDNIKLTLNEASLAVNVLLEDESVTTFYVFFPDPWPKRRHHRRRLITPEFLDLLHSKLIPNGSIHFATDHQDYADVVVKLFREDSRYEEIPPFQPSEDERTDFELVFRNLAKPISRISIRKHTRQRQ